MVRDDFVGTLNLKVKNKTVKVVVVLFKINKYVKVLKYSLKMLLVILDGPSKLQQLKKICYIQFHNLILLFDKCKVLLYELKIKFFI